VDDTAEEFDVDLSLDGAELDRVPAPKPDAHLNFPGAASHIFALEKRKPNRVRNTKPMAEARQMLATKSPALMARAIQVAMAGDDDMLKFLVGRILPKQLEIADESGGVGGQARGVPSADALLAAFASEFAARTGVKAVAALGEDGSVFSAEIRPGEDGHRAPVDVPEGEGSGSGPGRPPGSVEPGAS
jgi:hypothetical protein